jgi:hypothetical protein
MLKSKFELIVNWDENLLPEGWTRSAFTTYIENVVNAEVDELVGVKRTKTKFKKTTVPWYESDTDDSEV